MKRLIKNIFLVTLIISMLLCTCSCGGNNGMKRYSESGLIFSLPTYMQEFSVEYADLCYGNHEKNLEFFVYFYGSDALLTQLYLPTDCTVKDYAEWFVNMNEYEDVLEFYDEENARIVLEYIYEPEQIYFCDYILRNEYALFHVTMCCNAEDRETYSPIFEEWRGYISLDY